MAFKALSFEEIPQSQRGKVASADPQMSVTENGQVRANANGEKAIRAANEGNLPAGAFVLVDGLQIGLALIGSKTDLETAMTEKKHYAVKFSDKGVIFTMSNVLKKIGYDFTAAGDQKVNLEAAAKPVKIGGKASPLFTFTLPSNPVKPVKAPRKPRTPKTATPATTTTTVTPAVPPASADLDLEL